MTFEQICGHTAVLNRLSNIITQDKLSHAYIFCGQNGVGKHTVAKAWAQMITDNTSADIIEITNENYADSVKKTTKSSALSVDTVRAARDDMYLKPYMAEKRVFIIPNADTMTFQAQNALLKVFEEPPAYCVIIIIADNPEALLPTIRSRAVTVRFGNLSDDEINSFLDKNGITPSPFLTAMANGSIGKALTLAESPETLELVKDSSAYLSSVFTGQAIEKYKLIGFLQKNKANINIILNTFILFFEQSLLQLCGKNVTIPIRVIDGKIASQCITITEDCRRALKNNVNYNMAVSELVLNLAECLL